MTPSNTLTPRRILGLVGAIGIIAAGAAALAVYAKSTGHDTIASARQADAEPFHVHSGTTLVLHGSEVESFTSFGRMKASADASTVGRFGVLKIGRIIQGDSPEDQVVMGTITFTPERDLGGPTAVTAEIPIELVLPVISADEAKAKVASLGDGINNRRAIVFLHAKGKLVPAEAGFYRAISSQGLWVQDDQTGRSVTTPLSDERLDNIFAPDLQGVGSFDDLAARVARVKS